MEKVETSERCARVLAGEAEVRLAEWAKEEASAGRCPVDESRRQDLRAATQELRDKLGKLDAGRAAQGD